MPDPCKSASPNLLLVEGKDDCHVVLAVQHQANLTHRFGIFECGNDEEVLRRLNALIPSPAEIRPQKLGIVLDADEKSLSSRWAQVLGKLRNHGFECPSQADPEGSVIAGPDGFPTIGVWIMPNNSAPGNLEDFLITMADVRKLEYARGVVEAAIEQEVTTFSNAQKSKAIIYTYLAWQEPPGRPLGTSITSHVLNFQSGICPIFVRWLERLF